MGPARRKRRVAARIPQMPTRSLRKPAGRERSVPGKRHNSRIAAIIPCIPSFFFIYIDFFRKHGIIKTTTPEKPVISGLPGLSVTNALLFSLL